jgi:hypothetical protein
MKRSLILSAAVAALLSSAVAFGVEKYPVKPDLDKQNVENFDMQAARVRQDMDKGGRYEHIKEEDRARVEEGLTYMHDLIAASGSVGAMKEDDRIKLFNRQERINALLTHAENNRVICEKSIQPGTMFRLTTCKSVAERAQREQDAKNTLEAAQNHVEIGLGSAAAAQ